MVKHNDNSRIMFWMLVLSLVLSLTALMITFLDRSRLNPIVDSQTQDIVDNYYQTTRLRFCYERDINPCDDEALTAWNAAHPNDTIRVSSPELFD